MANLLFIYEFRDKSYGVAVPGVAGVPGTDGPVAKVTLTIFLFFFTVGFTYLFLSFFIMTLSFLVIFF